MFEAYPSIQRRTYEPAMASPPSFGLGGSTNHSLRDLRLAEPNQEVDRPIASQGIETDRRSFCVLPANPNPHSYTNFIMLHIYAEALDSLRVRLNMYLVFLKKIHLNFAVIAYDSRREIRVPGQFTFLTKKKNRLTH